MSYVLLQLHCFLASLSFQFILKCTTDCIFIELKFTWVCDWLIDPSTTLLCDPIYCCLLALSCVIQSTAAFLRFLVWSNLLPPCAFLSDPIYCHVLAFSCVIQSTASLRFLVWSNLLPPCAFLCDPIYCLLALSCVIQSTAVFLCVWSKPLPPSCTFLCDLLWSASDFLCAKIWHPWWQRHVMTMGWHAKIQHPWQGYVATMFWCAPKFSIHDKDMLQLRSRIPKFSIHEKDMMWLLLQCSCFIISLSICRCPVVII